MDADVSEIDWTDEERMQLSAAYMTAKPYAAARTMAVASLAVKLVAARAPLGPDSLDFCQRAWDDIPAYARVRTRKRAALGMLLEAYKVVVAQLAVLKSGRK